MSKVTVEMIQNPPPSEKRTLNKILKEGLMLGVWNLPYRLHLVNQDPGTTKTETFAMATSNLMTIVNNQEILHLI